MEPCRAQGLGFRVKGLGLRHYALGFRVLTYYLEVGHGAVAQGAVERAGYLPGVGLGCKV